MLVFCLFLYLIVGVTGQGFSTTFLQNALFGGDRSDFGVASYTDAERGIRYLVGQTYSSHFSGISSLEHSTIGTPDVLIVALNQNSDDLLWSKIVGTSRSDQPRAITGDSQGNIWITGQTFGSFDNNDNNGASRGFLIKMDSEGSVISSITFGSCQPASIAMDSQDNIWIVGSINNNNNDFADENVLLNDDVAVVIFSAQTGEQIITQTFGGSASDIAKTVIVAGNTVAIGGTTQSSDFPTTEGKRACDNCNGAGFVMTLEYGVETGIKQTFSTIIVGQEQESLSVVSIAFDNEDNMYLSLYDDANSMGSYIQQIKSDRSLGWVSEKSDAFWKVEYLPLIDALYTIGTYSTPSDYVTFYVLDVKTGIHVYASKPLTGSIVDATASNSDESSVKIHMIGTLQKDLRIVKHGRDYTNSHKSDDMLIISMVIRSLKHKPSADVDAKIARTQHAARDEVVATQCLWLHQSGFAAYNDLTTTYNVSGTSIILPFEAGHPDYDLNHAATLTKVVPATNYKAVRLPAGEWGVGFEAFIQFGYNYSQTQRPTGITYIEYDVVNADTAKLIISDSGRNWQTDAISWSIKLKIVSSGDEVTASLPTQVDASLSIWISYDGNSSTTADNIKVFASLDGTKPSSPSIKYTTTSEMNSAWTTKQNLLPSLWSGSTMETLLMKSHICGIKVPITTVPVVLNPPAPITGATTFPQPGSGEVAYVAQVVIPGADSIDGTQTKFAFLKGDGTPLATSSVYVYDSPYTGDPSKIKTNKLAGYFGYADISGTGTLAGWAFPSTKKFVGGKKYYFYIAAGLSASDNLATSDPALVPKRDVQARAGTDTPFLMYNKATGQFEEQPIQLVYTAASKPTVADPLAKLDPPSPPPAPGTPPPPSDGSGKGDPWFLGYNGQKFEFDGHAGGIYNIYNDPWINVNSLFGYANAKKHKGTVMHTMGISIGEHKLLFDISNRENKKIFDVLIDGVSTQIGSRVHHLTGCVDLQYNSKVILITTPRHSVRLTLQWGRNGHITENYFDVDIHHPEEDLTKIGGVLGQTASENFDDVDTTEADFEIEDIFSFEKSKFYNLQTISC